MSGETTATTTQAAPATTETKPAETTQAAPITQTTQATQEAAKTLFPATPQEIKYDLKLPEGSLLEDGALERIVAESKARRLSAEDAQSLVERENDAVARFVDRRIEKWQTETLSDPVLSSDGKMLKAEVLRDIDSVFDRFGQVGKRARAALMESGRADQKDVLHLFLAIGQAAKSHSVRGDATTASETKSDAEVLFGTIIK